MSVDAAIAAALTQIEHEHDLKVLYAAESGSRAWGFASPDSDYDVRYIYLKPLTWYLSVAEARDVHEAMLPGDLDLAGWELRKSLRLYAKGNMALNEWLGSAIVYRQPDPVVIKMRDGLGQWFQPLQGLHHYLSMARGTIDKHLLSDQVPIKKLFYALRPLLACRWICQHLSQPPTAFATLLAGIEFNPREQAEIRVVLDQKAEAVERQPLALNRWWRQWLGSEVDRIQASEGRLPHKKRLPISTLDSWLVQTLGQ